MTTLMDRKNFIGESEISQYFPVLNIEMMYRDISDRFATVYNRMKTDRQLYNDMSAEWNLANTAAKNRLAERRKFVRKYMRELGGFKGKMGETAYKIWAAGFEFQFSPEGRKRFTKDDREIAWYKQGGRSLYSGKEMSYEDMIKGAHMAHIFPFYLFGDLLEDNMILVFACENVFNGTNVMLPKNVTNK
jgi:hypothetical protein